MNMATKKITIPGQLNLALMCLAAVLQLNSVQAEVLLTDDFSVGTQVNPLEWRVPFGGDSSFLGRTQLKTDNAQLPSIVNGAAVFELDTFLDGSVFSGHEMITKRNFALGGGLVWKARMKLGSNTPNGVVGGGFLFDVTREMPVGTPVRDEIDVELLSNEANGSDRVLTNTWNDENFTTGAGASAFISGTPAYDLNQFNDYEIRWTPGQVQWSVNGAVVRTENGAEVPDDPMTSRFNIWVPDSDFSSAFDAGLTPAANAGASTTYTMEVDSVSIERINTTRGSNLLNNPGFESVSNSATDWTQFNRAFDNQDFVDDGNFSMLTFGPFNFGAPSGAKTDASGAFQTVQGITPGKEYSASVMAYSASTDSIFDRDNFTEIVLAFKDANGNVLEERKTPIFDGRDPLLSDVQDEWNEYVVEGLAPAGTTQATVSLFFIQLNDTLGDFDEDFDADGNDLLEWQRGNSPNMGDDADLATWEDNYGDPSTIFRNEGNGAIWFDSAQLVELIQIPQSSASVGVPEPSALLLAALGSCALLAGRFKRS